MQQAQTSKLIVSDADITSRCRCINVPGSYMIFPRANRVEHHLPGFEGILAQVLSTPQHGAKFVEHELLLEPNGKTTKTRQEEFEQFFYVLEGEVKFELEGKTHKMVEGNYAWLPPQAAYGLHNQSDALSRMVWIRRRYVQAEGIAIPAAILAHESDVRADPTDTYMEQHLTPYEQLGFDMGINMQVFDPGVYFSMVEAHVMEHGLYMVKGRGLYWLNHDLIEVQKDDYIYMAPFCPQFFYSTGWEKSAYLLYKDVNRDYTQFL
ncbi:MAG TPA: (S)-ureidoglycine aminohydrolase [Anaerolineales bacterium]